MIVPLCKNYNVWELRFVGVAVYGSCGVWESQSVDVTMCRGSNWWGSRCGSLGGFEVRGCGVGGCGEGSCFFATFYSKY